MSWNAEEAEIVYPFDYVVHTKEGENIYICIHNSAFGFCLKWQDQRLHSVLCRSLPSHMRAMYVLCLGEMGELWYASWMARVCLCAR